MATSGQIIIATGSNAGKTSYFNVTSNLRLIVDWTLKSQDIANNRSTVTVTMSVQHSQISLTAGSSDCSFIFGGVTTTWTGPNLSRSVNTSTTTVLKDGTATSHDIVINHASDGSFTGNLIAEYRLSSTNGFSYGGQTFGYLTNRNSPTSITLPTIARKSSFTVTGDNVGQNISFAISAASSSFTHALSFRYGSTTTAIASSIAAGTTSYTWAASSNRTTLSSTVTNASSMSVTFILTTKSGSTNIGTYEVTKTLVFPESTFKPTLSIVTNETSNRSSYLKGLSTVTVTPTSSPVYNSAIASYSASIGSKTYSGTTLAAIVSPILSTAGTVSIRFQVTNTRGYSAEQTATITVVNYNPPSIIDLTVRRCVSATDSTPDISGSGVYIEFKLSISTSPSGNALASGYPKAAYKRTSVTWETQAIAITSLSYNSSTGIYSKTMALSQDYSFDFRVQVKDSYSGDITSYNTVSTAFAILHIPESGKGLGIGGISTEDRLQVYMPTDLYSDVSFGNNITFERGLQTDERSIVFTNAQSSANHHNVKIYGGNPTSTTSIGVWDEDNYFHVAYYQESSKVLGVLSTDAAIAANSDVRILGYSMKNYLNNFGYVRNLTVNDNLNDIIKSGWYIQHDNVAALLSNNYPATQAGYLEVFTTSTSFENGAPRYILQRYTHFQTSCVWIRHYYIYNGNGGWGDWKIYSDITKERLAMTYTTNSYVNSSKFGYIEVYKMSDTYIINGNLELSSSIPTGTDWTEIGRFTGYSALTTQYLSVPSRNGSGVLAVRITSAGIMSIANVCGTTVSSYCQFSASVPRA